MLSSCISRVVLFLASLVARKLGRPLEKLISFDRSIPFLQIGFCGVKVQFCRLALLHDAWNVILLQAGLPLQLRTAVIEHFVLKLSICGPLRVEVKDVYILLKTSHERHYDAESETEKNVAWKEKQLARMKKEKSVTSSSKGWFKKKLSQLLNYIAFKLIQRLQVVGENIHVRVEDQLSSPGEPLATGFKLRHLSVKEDQEKRNISKGAFVKDVDLVDASLYWNSSTSDLLADLPEADILARMQAVPFTEAVGYSYILRPTSASASLYISRGVYSVVDAIVHAEVNGALKLRLSIHQLKSIIDLLGYLQQHQSTRLFLPYRPTVSIHGHAREWWKYAYRCVVHSIQQCTGMWVWEELKKQKDLCRSYEEQYETLLTAEKPPKKTKKILKAYVAEMSLMNILVSQRKVERSLRIRKLMDDLIDHMKGKKRTEQEVVEPVKTQPFLSASLESSFPEVQLQLVEDGESEETEVIGLRIDGSSASLVLQPKELSIGARVQSLKCVGLTKADGSSPVLFSMWNPNQSEPSTLPLMEANIKSYLQKVTGFPSKFDYEIDVALQPTVFVFDSETALKLAEAASLFLVSHDSLKDAARGVAHEAHYFGKKKIKKDFKDRKTVGLSVDLCLPIIVLPEDGERASSDKLLAFNPGHFMVQTKTNSTNMDEEFSLHYNVQLSGITLSLIHHEKNLDWQDVLHSGTPESELFSCRLISATALLTVPPRNKQLPPSINLEGIVPGVSLKLSNTLIMEGGVFVSKQAVMVRKVVAAITGPKPSNEMKALKPPVGYTPSDPSAGKVMEDIESMTTRSHLSGHSAPLPDSDEPDGEEHSFLSARCRIEEVCISVSEFDGSQTNTYLFMDVRGIEVSVAQKDSAFHCQFGVASIGLKEQLSYRPDGTLLEIITTQKDFLSSSICIADPSSEYFKSRHGAVKTDVSVHLSSCVLYIADDSLLHFVKFVLKLELHRLFSENVESTTTLPCSSLPKKALKVKLPQRDNVIDVQVCVKANEFLLVLSGTGPIADICINGIDANLKDTAMQTSVTASARNVTVNDCLLPHSVYQKVVSNKPTEDFVNVKCILWKQVANDSSDDLKMEAAISIGEIKTTLLLKFIKTVQLYTHRLIHKSIKKWKKHWAPHRTTLQPKQEATTGPPFRYHVTLDVHTVVLVLPNSSSTLDQVDLELHNLHLSNNFVHESHPTTCERDGPAATLVDKMAIQFTNFSVTRCGPKGNVVSTMAVAPEFISTFSRRVVCGSVTTSPKFSVDMSFKEIEVTLSNEDLAVLPLIILNNISEEEPLKLTFKSPSPPPEKSLDKPHTSATEEKLFHAGFSIQTLKCTLSLLESQDSSETYTEDEGSVVLQRLYQIMLTQLSAQVDYYYDKSLQTSGFLKDLSILDISNAANNSRVISQTFYNEDADNVLLQFSASRATTKDIHVEVKLNHMYACVWPSLVMNLLKFAMASVPQFESGSIVQTKTTESEGSSMVLKAVIQMDSVSFALLDGPTDTGDSVYGTCVELKSNKCQDPALQFEFSMTPTQNHLSTTIWIEVGTCIAGQKIMKLTQMLDPCCLQATYLRSDTEEKAKLSASTMVFFITSEAILVTLKPIKECIQGLHQVRSESPEKLEELRMDIWEVKEIVREEVLAVKEDPHATVEKKAIHARTQEATISLPEVVINYDVMYAGDSSSLLCLTSVVEAAVTSWSTELMSDAEIKADAFIYNRRVAAWEPFLEPVEDQINECYRPWIMVVKVRQVDGSGGGTPTKGPVALSTDASSRKQFIPSSQSFLKSDTRETSASAVAHSIGLSSSVESEGSEEGGNDKSTVVIVSSDDRLEFTVSPGTLDTIQELVNALSEDDSEVRDHLLNCVHFSKPPLQIHNKTGLNLTVFPGPTFKLASSGPSYSTPVSMSHESNLKHMESLDVDCEHLSEGLFSSIVGHVSTVFGSTSEAAPSSLEKPVSRVVMDGVEEPTLSLSYCNLNEMACADDEEVTEVYPDERGQEGETTSDEPDLGVIRPTKPGESTIRAVTVTGSVMGKASLRKKIEWKPKSLSKNHKICIQPRSQSFRLFSTAGKEKVGKPGNEASFIPHGMGQSQGEGGRKSTPISISLPGCAAIPLYIPPADGLGKTICGISEVRVVKGVRKVTIRSGLQVKNDLPVLVSLYVHTNNKSHPLTEIDQGATYDVPLKVVDSNCPFQVGVGSGGYFCDDILDWKKMAEWKETAVLACPENTPDGEHFYIQVTVKTSHVIQRRGHLDFKAHVIELKPPLTIKNLLPLAADVSFKDAPTAGSFTVRPEESEEFYRLDPRREHTLVVQLPQYNGLKWEGEVVMSVAKSSNTRLKLFGYNSHGQQEDKMNLGLYFDEKQPFLFQLYCTYWVINKTGLPLEYEYQSSHKLRNVKTIATGSENSVSLIYFKPTVEEKNRKLKMRVAGGKWSKPFVLGTNAGSVTTTTSEEQLYEFGIQSPFTVNTLIHVIYILPKYMLHNMTQIPITFIAHSEMGGQSGEQYSVTLQPNELKSFWPGKSQEAVLAIQDGFLTKPFSLEDVSTTLLATQLQNELSGLSVQTNSSGHCVLVTVSPYSEGGAPFRVENRCRELSINFAQQGCGQHYVLSPYKSLLYTWDNPLGQRQLMWQVVGEAAESWTSIEFNQKYGRRKVKLVMGGEVVEVMWEVSFDGSQQVLRLFDTPEEYQQALQMELPPTMVKSFQFFCSLEGVGLSVVNNTPVEVAYCCILSSPTVWLKRRPGGKWRVMEPEKSVAIETAWRTGEESVEIDGEAFDLQEMLVRSSKGGSLSRTFNPGIWLWASVTAQQYAFNLKLGRVQVDNQLQEYVLQNRIVFAPEKGMDPSEVIAPFLDTMVIMKKPGKRQKVVDIEKAYLELKAMQVNIELGLVAALVSLLEPFLEKELSTQIHNDMELVNKSIGDLHHINHASTSKSQTHFDKFQLAPIKVAVTYTTAGDYDFSSVLGTILDSIVHFAILTKGSFNIDLSAIEFTNKTLDHHQLIQMLVKNYRNEVLFQLYEVAFGLDLIGNPARLLRHFEVGAKDFISDSRRGLEEQEFGAGVVGVAAGVKDFLGHAIEGSAESVSSTTGSFSSTLLATTDIDYRKKHRHLVHTTSEGLTPNLLLGTRFFAEGLFHGITDIFVKPITGAQRGGVAGFFGGVGKGALSILTKPTLGVLDLAHFTLEGIRSAAGDDPEYQTVRLTRFIDHDKVLTPFNTHEAEGLHIIWSMTDHNKEGYYGHEWQPSKHEGKEPRAFLVSSLHLFSVKRDGMKFEVDDWSAKVEYLEQWDVIPEGGDRGPAVYIEYGEDSFLDKVGSRLFHYDDHKPEEMKITTFDMISEAAAQYIYEKITEAWNAQHIDS